MFECPKTKNIQIFEMQPYFDQTDRETPLFNAEVKGSRTE